jgi:hypothetical protein
MRTDPTMTDNAAGNVICVLGMHRSGTSCLVGSLQKAGLQLGKHHTWNRYNQKGNRENQDIVDLNDDILAHNGGSWQSPPRKITWSEDHLTRARAIVSSFPPHSRWGFKDPRALLTFPMWRLALEDKYQRVGIFRHPLAVAASLGYRHGTSALPEEKSLELWYIYNRKLLEEYKRSPFPVLCFDWEEQQFHDKLAVVQEQLGLAAVTDDARFYSSQLKNYASKDLSIIPRKYRTLYKNLKAIVC